MKKAALILLTLLVALLPIISLAEDLAITITPDKASYTATEVATLNISIVNNTGATVKNLKISNFIPTGLEYVHPADAEKTIAELKSGASAQHKIQMRLIPVVTPQTGDSFPLGLWIGVFAAAAVCLTFILVWRRRRSK